MRSQSYRTLNLQSRELPSLQGIWTDGKFDYDNEKWTDAFGTPIPDYFWENSTLLRKAFDQITQILSILPLVFSPISYGPQIIYSIAHIMRLNKLSYMIKE